VKAEASRTEERVFRQDRRHVLVAEDDAELRSLMALALEAEGCLVSQVKDGRELLELLRENCLVDVVISDVRMPGRSGLEALSEFRKSNGSTTFVFDKPFEMDDLRALVRRLTVPPRGTEDRGSGVIPPPFTEGA
jgi:CheY-like chemotaxis protein